MYPHCNHSVVGPVIPILREHLKELRDRLARVAYERDIDSIEFLLKQISIVKTTMADPFHILAGCVTERDFIIEAWRWNFAEKGYGQMDGGYITRGQDRIIGELHGGRPHIWHHGGPHGTTSSGGCLWLS